MYISIAAGVPLSLLNKYTISRTQVLFYTHGTCIPSLPLAESEEILRQLHPEPDEVAMNLEKIMSLLVYLREEQDGIVRELRRVGSRCGVDEIDVGGNNAPMGGGEDRGEGWRRRVDKLEEEMEKLRGLLGDVVNKGGLLGGKALEPDVTLGEAVRDGDRANLAKRKRIEKPAVEVNKRIAKSPSPTFIQQRRDKSSAKPAVVPPVIAKHAVVPRVMAKPWIVTPVMKAKGKEDVVGIEESEADEGGEGSDSEDEGEEVSDSEEEDKEEGKEGEGEGEEEEEEEEEDEGGDEEEDEDEDEDEEESEEEEEETPPASAKRKTTKAAPADAQSKTRETVQGKIDNGREKENERREWKGKERDREKEKVKQKQQEEEKERATRLRTSLTQANGSKVGLIARRKTAGGR
ncbi:hypothetical protein BGX38DRAFT_851970 [Terfezia claveryi]|nr:hypothetical protein BGX38DRAFT_851970 [Terfezia claveryi]